MILFIKIFHNVPIIVIVAILNSIPPSTSNRLILTGAFPNQFIDIDDNDRTVSRTIIDEILKTKSITIVDVNTSEISISNSRGIVFLLKDPSSASNNPEIFEFLKFSTYSDFQDF
jgi:hypothetical protein